MGTTRQDDLIQAALRAANIPPPDAETPQPAPEQQHASQTLARLAGTRHPRPGTVCEHCPNSVWFASAAEVRCYCRIMYLVTWSSQEPQQLTHCDGRSLT